MRILQTDLDEQLSIHYMMLTRQKTKLADCFQHIFRLNTCPEGKDLKGLTLTGYRAYAQTELSDVIVQVEKLCQALGLDFTETLRMGRQRDREKEAEYVAKHPGDYWV